MRAPSASLRQTVASHYTVAERLVNTRRFRLSRCALSEHGMSHMPFLQNITAQASCAGHFRWTRADLELCLLAPGMTPSRAEYLQEVAKSAKCACCLSVNSVDPANCLYDFGQDGPVFQNTDLNLHPGTLQLASKLMKVQCRGQTTRT